MLVDPARHPHVQTEAAEKFLLYLAKESTQKLISDFGLDSHGQPLFFVN
jgi:ABC-type tungstate transport system permease subunit